MSVVYKLPIVKVLVTQSYPTPCDPLDYSTPESSVHGIFQARILAWVAIFPSPGNISGRDRTQFSSIAGRILFHLSHQGSPFKPPAAAAAAAAAKSLQSWDPIDGSPPGSPVPGILQA